MYYGIELYLLKVLKKRTNALDKNGYLSAESLTNYVFDEMHEKDYKIQKHPDRKTIIKCVYALKKFGEPIVIKTNKGIAYGGQLYTKKELDFLHKAIFDSVELNDFEKKDLFKKICDDYYERAFINNVNR